MRLLGEQRHTKKIYVIPCRFTYICYCFSRIRIVYSIILNTFLNTGGEFDYLIIFALVMCVCVEHQETLSHRLFIPCFFYEH